jgi:hypothetical protein
MPGRRLRNLEPPIGDQNGEAPCGATHTTRRLIGSGWGDVRADQVHLASKGVAWGR